MNRFVKRTECVILYLNDFRISTLQNVLNKM